MQKWRGEEVDDSVVEGQKSYCDGNKDGDFEQIFYSF